MDIFSEPIKWDETQLRIEVLRQLYITFQNKEQLADGLSPGYLMKKLNAELSVFERSVEWLLDKNYIYVGSRAFLISSDGIEYLSENDAPPSNDFSKIPRKPFPSAGDVSATLDKPEEEDSNFD